MASNSRENVCQALARQALEARESSYCPYSHFAVGAALLCADGTVYLGCNIECASNGGTNCAERTAFFKAVSEGKRNFTAIAVAGGAAGKAPESFCAPCGICRQVMREFCGDDFTVVLTNGKALEIHSLGELLPCSFGPGDLTGKKD